jgi:rubrerythrin
MFGTLPEIHKPQVWVSAADQERARELLEVDEQQQAERKQTTREGTPAAPIEVVCEECQQNASYPAEQRGTVQDCPHCGAYVDVESGDEGDRFWLESDKPDGG